MTDAIEKFTPLGIQLKSGDTLQADFIVTATGFEFQVLGGIEVVVDGQKVNASKTFYYKGAMLSNEPNLVTIFGFVNASWTLKADLIIQYACHVLNYRDEHQMKQATPRLPEDTTLMAPSNLGIYNEGNNSWLSKVKKNLG